MVEPGCVCERWIGAALGAVFVDEGALKVFEPREPMPPPPPGRASATGAATASIAASAKTVAARVRRVEGMNMNTPLNEV